MLFFHPLKLHGLIGLNLIQHFIKLNEWKRLNLKWFFIMAQLSFPLNTPLSGKVRRSVWYSEGVLSLTQPSKIHIMYVWHLNLTSSPPWTDGDSQTSRFRFLFLSRRIFRTCLNRFTLFWSYSRDPDWHRKPCGQNIFTGVNISVMVRPTVWTVPFSNI